MKSKKLNGTVIVTYRCNARCSMCNRYKAPSKPEEEITIDTIRTLQILREENHLLEQTFLKLSENYIKNLIELLFQLMAILQTELYLW